MNRRDFICRVAAAASVASTSCRTSEMDCELLGGLSILDSGFLESREICGRRRSVRIKRETDPFWSGERSIVGSDSSATLLLVRESGARPIYINCCDIEGQIRKRITIGLKGRLESIALVPNSAQALAVVCDSPDRPERAQVYFGNGLREDWQMVASIKCPEIAGVTSDGSVVLWGENSAVWSVDLRSLQKRKILDGGDTPCISPDAKMLYYRQLPDFIPTFLSWPSMERIHECSKGGFGALAKWTPASDAIMVERRGLPFLEAFVLAPRTGKLVSLGAARAMGTVSQTWNFIQWGSEGPRLLRDFRYRDARGSILAPRIDNRTGSIGSL